MTTSDGMAERMATALANSIERDPNGHAYWKGAIVSGENQDGTELLIDVPDRGNLRTFIAHVREVDPPDGNDAKIQRLASLLEAGMEAATYEWISEDEREQLATWLVNNGVML